MDQPVQKHRRNVETYLLESHVGYDVLDAFVQANVDMDRVTLDELESIVGQFARRRGVGVPQKNASR